MVQSGSRDAGLEHSPQRVVALVEQAWQAMS